MEFKALALEPWQRGEKMMSRQHSCKAKAKAPLHMSYRFALLSHAHTEKPEIAVVIGDYVKACEISTG